MQGIDGARPGIVFKAAPGWRYLIQRLIVQKHLRSAAVRAIGVGVRLHQWRRRVRQQPAGQDAEALAALRQVGLAHLSPVFSTEQLDAIDAYLVDKRFFDHRAPGQTFCLDDRPAGMSLGDYSLRDVMHCPHVLALANSPRLLAFASAFLGCPPTVSALSLRWSFPSPTVADNVQTFHRDPDDWRFFKLFVYLTDVDPDAGPHVFVRGSHMAPGSIRSKIYSDAEVAAGYGAHSLSVVTGPRGCSFVVNTHGIHKGVVPRSVPRLMLQIQYSMLPVFAIDYHPEPYAVANTFDPYINRLIMQTPAAAALAA